MVLELASLEKKKEERRKKKERKKEDDDFRFFQSLFSRLLKSRAEIRGHICTQEGQGFP